MDTRVCGTRGTHVKAAAGPAIKVFPERKSTELDLSPSAVTLLGLDCTGMHGAELVAALLPAGLERLELTADTNGNGLPTWACGPAQDPPGCLAGLHTLRNATHRVAARREWGLRWADRVPACRWPHLAWR